MNPRLSVVAATAAILASTALYPLVSGGIWFWAGAGAVVVAVAFSALARLRMLPAVICFLAALAAEFIYLNAAFAGRWSWLGLIPTKSSLHHLGALMSQANAEMARFAPPVPAGHGVELLAAAGIGLVGALTDLLAVRLHRPALAGLPLLVLFCVPMTTDAKPGWLGGTLVFCISMAGYLGLLAADGRDRLRLWGRLVHRWQGEMEGRSPDTRPLTAAGRRIGSAAVVMALCIPLLVPGLKQHRIFPGNGGVGSNGYTGPISLPDPLDELNQQLHETHPLAVLNYHTADPSPPYLQVYVLGRLGEHAWSMAPPKVTDALANGNLPAVPGLAASTPSVAVRETISLSANLSSGRAKLSYLPLPYAARSVRVDGSWRVDPGGLTVLSEGAKLSGLRYSVTSKDINPSAQQLRDAPPPPASLTGFLTVPQAFNGLAGLASRITAGRTTPYGKAVALQQWFTTDGNFTYSLHVPAPGSAGSLVRFLTKTKKGYCQQFAFAMAVLARLEHIPSRVVVGYTQGTYLSNDLWQVKTSDAHAWPELYFAGSGWLRFEPTPSGSVGQGTATTPPYSTPGGPPVTSLPPSVTRPQGGLGPQPTVTATGQNLLRNVTKPQDSGGASGLSHKASRTSLTVLALVLLGLMLITPRTSRTLTRQWRWWRAGDDAMRAHTAWRELRDDLADRRIDWAASESSRALAGRLAGTLGLAGPALAALERIARAEERASYAASPEPGARLRKDVAQVRRAVSRCCGRAVRVYAVLLPSSALVPMRRGFQQALDVFGWIDVIMTKIHGGASGGGTEIAFAWRARRPRSATLS
jgi:transglutaminase-like putative cysteine protease